MLPIEDALPALKSALAAQPGCVLAAPPGAGKTTRVPLALMDEPWARGGKLILLSPRRIAARAAAARMAAQLGEPVGRTIGFRVRLESRVSAATRVEVVTEGVFTRMILADPALEGVAGVLFDEFHERSLEGDLALALALDSQAALRSDLRLLVMSATLDAAGAARLLGDAPVVETKGRLFPIATRYLGRRGEDAAAQTADAARAALAAEEGGVLCFLPGAGEIERAARLLREQVKDSSVDIRPLYGAMDARAQDEAIAPAPPGRRKIVLATAIAETSLTIEGVRVVIDAGLARRAEYEPDTGLTRLVTRRASQAAVEQRRGRAGRTAPGACWRLWDEGETRALIPFDPPEILEADLSGFALDLAAWGVREPGGLRWLDPPPAAAWNEAVALLTRLGARDEAGALTAHGRGLAEFALPPALAHMVVKAGESGRARLAARLALLLSEEGLGGRDVDARVRLENFARERGQRAEAARRLADRLAARAGAREEEPIDVDAAGAVLAAALPERVAKARTKGGGEFVLANGRGARLDASDPLAREEFLLAADLTGRAARAVIRFAAPLAPREVEALFADRIDAAETAAFAADGAIRAVRVRRLGAIVLSETPLARPPPAAVAAAILDLARREGVRALPWGEAEAAFRARIAFVREVESEAAWPDLSDAALERDLAWLEPHLDGVGDLRALADGRLLRALRAMLSYTQTRRLDEAAPAVFATPLGAQVRIDYAAEGGPAIAVRLQEMFGVARHPTIQAGDTPLAVTLLSPAQRPIQKTADLPRFWAGSYAAVRAEMRGRYPKHPWPDDPLAAAPTNRAKPRGS
ncbi:MAG: ATP-dependent helicase HrpB [Hyphomonadaceae bacterium]